MIGGTQARHPDPEAPVPLQQVTFDPKGPQLEAEVRSGFAQAGAYVLTLWDHNKVQSRWEGTFFNPDDDTFTLPGKAAEQNGRLVQCLFSVEILPPEKRYALMLTIWQGSQKVGVLTEAGETSESQVMKNLYARLVAP
jgi:hypothetical protein